MKEPELAELFNRELDGLLAGGAAGESCDPGALGLASALAAADFSGDSRIKQSLRVRLVSGAAQTGTVAEILRGLFSSVYARAAFAAACLLLLLLPLSRREPTAPAPVPAPAVTAAARPAAPPAPQAAEPLPPPARAVLSMRSLSQVNLPGFFKSVPMPRLEGEPIAKFPIKSAGVLPIILAEGKEVKTEAGTGIVWETEGAVFTLGRRAITPEELFEVRSI